MFRASLPFPIPEPEHCQQQRTLDEHEHDHGPEEDPAEQIVEAGREVRCGAKR
jgi:hypothetical protein